jgi:hypothetical protein
MLRTPSLACAAALPAVLVGFAPGASAAALHRQCVIDTRHYPHVPPWQAATFAANDHHCFNG